MKIINKTRNTTISQQTELADTALSRLVGLLGRDNLPQGHGFIITQCRSIHMLFMRFTIDVIFVDKNNKVTGLVKRIKPYRMGPYFIRASYCIELPEGTIDETQTQIGDELIKEA